MIDSINKFKYNSSGKLIEKEHDNAEQVEIIGGSQNNTPIYKETYAYDDYLNIIMKHYQSSRTNEINRYEYTFDKNNNWIKRISFRNDEPILITEREIIYKQ